MSAHTPGPWVLGDENDSCCDVTAGRVSISLDRSDIHTGARIISREEMLANAHLVAAAPEMLAALKETMHGGEPTVEMFHRIMGIIAKADGRAS